MIKDLRLKNKNHKSSIVNHKSIPIQYQKGYVEFYKLKFKVTPDVLIPRPETELLVDEILKFYTLNPKPYTLIDVGTGAGNIAISIAKKAPQIKIVATDISKKALKVAKQNANLHGVTDQLTFIQGDLLHYDSLEYHSQPDIIVTNLPYIPSARIPYLDSSVKDHEPHIALDGGKDGFNLYRKLFKQIITHAGCGLGRHLGLLVAEIDYTHGELATNEAKKYFPNHKVEVKTDLAHKQRILIIK